jgi:hypothetical protein
MLNNKKRKCNRCDRLNTKKCNITSELILNNFNQSKKKIKVNLPNYFKSNNIRICEDCGAFSWETDFLGERDYKYGSQGTLENFMKYSISENRCITESKDTYEIKFWYK